MKESEAFAEARKYVRRCREKGRSDEAIAQSLHQRGWTQEQIAVLGFDSIELSAERYSARAPAKVDPLATVSNQYRALAQAVKDYWRENAIAWWSSSGRTEASCDARGESILQGEGFKTGSNLICEQCANRRLTEHADWEQAVRDLRTWFGADVPQRLVSMAEKLWDAPSPSATAKFTLRIGSVFDSDVGVMVAGLPEGVPPTVGDDIEVVSAE